MSEVMAEEIKRWTAKRKSALVVEIIQGKTTVAEAAGRLTSARLRLRDGSKMAVKAWRMLCAPTLLMYARNMRSS